ncbi:MULTISPECIES: hypothetical protein [Streptomyces rochei group]|uniref:hypothetical protein n=1 Tax=Streptomyces rochei group TaxID=2867164 RepID=UPI001874DE9F|nr:hypothetical protein [Streptomyces vinaceusdrappus]GHC44333.1 hypothetical protein GCM10010308_74470 [Streptomyces vinaceusdrappus]
MTTQTAPATCGAARDVLPCVLNADHGGQFHEDVNGYRWPTAAAMRQAAEDLRPSGLAALLAHVAANLPDDDQAPAERKPSAVVTLSPTADPDEITLAAESHGMNPARVAYGLRLAADEFDHRARAQGDEPIPYPTTAKNVDADLVPYHGEHGYPEGEEPTHQGPHPEHGGLETHRGTRENCTGPDCGPVDTRRYWIAVDVPTDDVDDHLDDALTHAADRAAAVLQEEHGYEATAWRAAEQSPAPGWTLTPDTLNTFLRSLVNELDYDLHKSWESNEETGEDDYPKLVVEAGKMLDAITAPAAEEPRTPTVGDRYVKRDAPDAGRIVTVDRVWTADDGHTAIAYEWRDDKPGQCRSACPLDVFHRTYEAQQPANAEEAPADTARRYAVRVVELEQRIERTLADHTRFIDSPHCAHDGEPWPCPTVTVLAPEAQQ